MGIGRQIIDPLGMQSANLLIRESTFDDCTLFAKWEQQPYIIDSFTMSRGRDYEEIVREYVTHSLDADKRQFTIVLGETSRPIGRVYISRIDTVNDSLDMTRIYIGEEDCIGKGYGKEALHLLLEYFFIKLHMERATLDHLPNNNRAAALYKKVGFQYEGVLRNTSKKDGKYVDLHLMSILRAEYFEKYHQFV